jgi:putative pyruvate formate lyase activating enzyme
MPENVQALRRLLADCTLCPRSCHVDRTAGQIGQCRVGADPVVASAGPHFGEEPPLVGSGGSGTIFLAGCNLHCVFCQNCDISQNTPGRAVSTRQLAEMALGLQRTGCANVNFVSPTHVVHALAEAVVIARAEGLTVPVVYNSGGYDAMPVLRLLTGLVDIYMPDFKWADADAGRLYSDVLDYPHVAEAALREMHRQVGPLELDHAGVAARGVLVRHLVMPRDLARSQDVINTVAAAAPGCAINIMDQYRPCYHANDHLALLDRPDPQTVSDLRTHAASLGLQVIQ